MSNTQSAILAQLVPYGLILILVAGLGGRRPAKSAVAGLGAVALAAVSLWACGFAFLAGGIGLTSSLPGLEGLVWEWASPFRLDWGVLGLRGFFLLGEASSPIALDLFLAILPSLTVAVAFPVLTLGERAPGWMAAVTGAFVGALVFPMIGNWISGGGWLMHIGQTLGMGVGYVDSTGLGTAALVGGLASLLGVLVFGRRLPPLPDGEAPTLPPVHLPVLAMAGAGLASAGAMALAGADPVRALSGLGASRAPVNLALAAAAGALLPCLYTWFTTGAADSLAAARGAAVALIAVSGSSPFLAPWAALVTGAIAGLLVPLATFVLRQILRIEDAVGAISVGLLGGVLGALAPGFLADGLAGAGWNGTGGQGVQGVTGLAGAHGLPAGGQGQIQAQLVGLAAIAAATALLLAALYLVLRVLHLLWRAVPAPSEEG